MKNIELVIPKLNQYSYEQKLESDPKTMSYNAGYNVSYFGYHYNTGCIDFPKEKWRDTYNKRINENKYFAKIVLLIDMLDMLIINIIKMMIFMNVAF